jgi:hypothetical protein
MRAPQARVRFGLVALTLATLGFLCGGSEETAAPQPNLPDEIERGSSRAPLPETSAIPKDRPLAAHMLRIAPGTFTMGTAASCPGTWRIARGGRVGSQAEDVNVTRRGDRSLASVVHTGILLARNAPPEGRARR